jgi:DNA-binding IclR family transcriptional regulator
VAGNSGEPGRTVVSRVASILNSFASTEEQSLTEVAQSAKLSVSTAHRLLAELVKRQLLARDPDGRFRVGLSLHRISASGQGENTMIEDRAAPLLADLAAATGCRIRLGVLAWQNMAYIETRPDTCPVTAFTPDATLPAATSALGRALLAYAPPAVVDAVTDGPGRAEPSAPTTSALRRSLAVVCRRQMAINPGGGQNGHCCFAKPVFGPGGDVVAALGMTVTDLDAALKPLIALPTIAARSLSRELGGSRGPVHFSLAGRCVR